MQVDLGYSESREGRRKEARYRIEIPRSRLDRQNRIESRYIDRQIDQTGKYNIVKARMILLASSNRIEKGTIPIKECINWFLMESCFGGEYRKQGNEGNITQNAFFHKEYYHDCEDDQKGGQRGDITEWKVIENHQKKKKKKKEKNILMNRRYLK